MTPTSRDVAAAAGVSVATVSYVMNERTDRRISDATRDRVLQAARELGYAPNHAAQNLRRRRTQQVCLVVGGIGNPANDLLSRSLHTEAENAGYGVITVVVDSASSANRLISRFRQGFVDGALFTTGLRWFSEDDFAALAARGLPIVTMNNFVTPRGFDVVRAPEGPPCEEALEYLVASGRRRIAFLGHRGEVAEFGESGNTVNERLNAYLDVLKRHGRTDDEWIIVDGADDRLSGYEAAAALLQRRQRPDAIFSASSRAAISAIWAARDAGLNLPDELAVIGVGNLPEAQITRPPLSIVGPEHQDFTEAAQLLLDRVGSDQPIEGREVTTPWTFVKRQSS